MDFKIDENLPSEVCQALHDAGHDALSVLDQRLGGQPDNSIVGVCKRESRILVTLDTDFANILAYPPGEFAGIIVIRTDEQSKRTVMAIMRRVIEALESELPTRRLWIVESRRIRVRGSE